MLSSFFAIIINYWLATCTNFFYTHRWLALSWCSRIIILLSWHKLNNNTTTWNNTLLGIAYDSPCASNRSVRKEPKAIDMLSTRFRCPHRFPGDRFFLFTSFARRSSRRILRRYRRSAAGWWRPSSWLHRGQGKTSFMTCRFFWFPALFRDRSSHISASA